MARRCTVCAFDNELDDRWCGGCARALPARGMAAASVSGPVAVPAAAPAAPNEPRRARPVQTSSAAAALLAINRRRSDAPSGGGVDVHDQDQLDAIFGARE